MRSIEPLLPPVCPPPGGLAEAERLQREACTRLREIEHWRRLVDARLDLAIAALAAPGRPAAHLDDHPDDHPDDHRADRLDGHRDDRPSDHQGGRERDHLADRLADVLDLPAGEAALAEVALLLRLREARSELDSRARALRLASEAASRTLAHLVLAERRARQGHRDTPATVTRLRP